MSSKSLQHKLTRVRPPRVHITTDVETGNAIEMKELPFVLGVLGDFSGQADERELVDRKFIEINPDNFDEILKRMNPRLTTTVANVLERDENGKVIPNAPKLAVDLQFEALEDFEPQRIAEKLPALKDILDLKTKLSDLKGTLQGNVKFEKLLQDAVQNTEKRGQLASELQQAPPKEDQ